MDYFIVILLFGTIILLTHFLEGITGFGCTVLAMPFCILLVGIDIAKPVLTVLGLLLCLYVVVIAFRDILWHAYFKILGFVLLGLPFGMIAFNKIPENILRMLLGMFMIIVAIRGLLIHYRPDYQPKTIKDYILKIILFLGGCIHGAFTSGGPLLIIYVVEKIPDKHEFRATLCMVWVTLNSILVIESLLNGSLNYQASSLILYALPFLAVGALLGNWTHHRIQSRLFSKLVYIVLLISALFMFI